MAVDPQLRQLARRIRNLEKNQLKQKQPTLGFSSIEGGSLPVRDEDGVVRQIIGTQVDGTVTTVDVNGPPPPTPLAPTLTTFPGVLVVSSYGLTVDDVPWPLDFLSLDVHVSPTADFVPSLVTRIGSFSIEGGSVSLGLGVGTYYVKLVAVSTSGTKSPASAELSATVPEPLQGEQGVPGPPGEDGASLYTWIKYADSPTSGMADDPTGKAYLGIAYNKTTPTESSTYADYSWSLVEGPQGPQGEQGVPGVEGPAGADGQPTYTWVKYGTSATGDGLSDDPTGKTYIGLAYNKLTATESTNPADYQWALIQGPEGDQGPQGVQGPAGADGTPTYTWIKYADSPTTGMSDSPTGKTYLGLAHNKTTATESTNYADYSWSLIQGPQGPQGSQGVQGPAGADGQTLYTWVKYADSPTTGMSDSPTGKAYLGLAYNKTTATESSTYSDYSWSLIEGEQGDQGVQGPAGADGSPTYTWVKYADDAAGAGMSDSPTGKTYLGLAYNKLTATESTTPGDYAWSLIQGPQGPQGSQGVQGPAGADGATLYTWVKYADTPTTGMADSPTGKAYLGLAYNKTTATESTNYADYSWSLIEGEQGDQGVQGPAGADGQTLYTWVKYADSPTTGMSDSPTGKAYLGLAYNKTTATESTNYADYAWSLIEGPQGSQGIQGPAGADGQPTYTWIKYADNISGGGMSDSPVGKAYIGLAYNKTTATESSTPGDYQWALIQGPGRIYRQDDPPTGLVAGDIATWYDTSPEAGNKQHYWNGSAWIEVLIGSNATSEDLIAGKKVPLDQAMSLEWGVPDPSEVLSTDDEFRVGMEHIGDLNIGVFDGWHGLVLDNGVWYVAISGNVDGKGVTYLRGSDGSERRLFEFSFLAGANSFGSGQLTKIGSTWYVLNYSGYTGNFLHTVHRLDSSFNVIGSFQFTLSVGAWGFTNDGTSLLVGSGTSTVEFRNATTGAVSSTVILNSMPSGIRTSLHYGTLDFGATRIAVGLSGSPVSGQSQVWSFNTSGVAQSAEHFPLKPRGDSDVTGIGWDGSRWVVSTLFRGLRRGTTSTGSGTVWASYAHYGQGSGLETAAAPVSSIGVTVPKRHGLLINGYVAMPPLVDEDPAPDTARVYLYTGATQPALSALRRVSALPTLKEYGTGAGREYDMFVPAPFTRTADAPPTTSTFPAGAAGEMASELGGFSVRGDGTGDWPYLRKAIEEAMSSLYSPLGHKHSDLSLRIEATRPVGEVTLWYGAKADCPAGWLVLDGSTYSSSTFPALFSHLGTTTLPNMEDRVPMGASGTKAVKSTGGADSVTLTVGQLPPHDHNMAHNHPVPRKANVGSSTGYARGNGTNEPNDDTNAASSNTTGSTGNGNAIDITPKYLAFHYIMRAKAA